MALKYGDIVRNKKTNDYGAIYDTINSDINLFSVSWLKTPDDDCLESGDDLELIYPAYKYFIRDMMLGDIKEAKATLESTINWIENQE